MSKLVNMAKKRLSDKEFWTILRENAGIYSRTAQAIRSQFGIEYSRQAVKDRAEKRPELLSNILEENIDVAEDGLLSLMKSKNERVRLKSIEFFLRTRGASRGYVMQTLTDITTKGQSLNKSFYDFLREVCIDEDE